uniref:Sushi domain-containing protein n=1 Tax=Hippocampus comes TaxID=109280 RepID=A0A3Q2YV81_HIPCM
MCTATQQVNKITCPAPEAPKNGHVNCTPSLLSSRSRFPHNSVCTFSCQEGYVLQGVVSMACTDSGNWTVAPPTCEVVQCDKTVQCPAPPNLHNGAVSYGDDPATRFSYEKNCSFRCKIGYRMKGMACTDSGNWTIAPPTCKGVKCSAPPPLPNGAVSCGDDPATRFSYENNCTFRCDIGYQMKGPESVTCTSAAQWSDMPRCECKRIK